MSSGTLNRRQFVVLGGATVFGMAAGIPVFGTPLPASFVSVGYHPGHLRRRIAGRSGTTMRFVDAGSVLTGDPRLFRDGARVRLHSFARAEGNSRAARIDVEALFRTPELDEPVPFFAFSSIAEPRRQMTSKSVAFNIPVESTESFELAVERRDLSEGGNTERVVIPFAVNDGAAPAIKLNEGIFVLAIVPAGQAMPDWSSMRTSSVVSRGDKTPVTLEIDSFGSSSVPFDYIVMSVTRRRGPEEVEPEVDAAELEHLGQE